MDEPVRTPESPMLTLRSRRNDARFRPFEPMLVSTGSSFPVRFAFSPPTCSAS